MSEHPTEEEKSNMSDTDHPVERTGLLLASNSIKVRKITILSGRMG